MVLTIGCVDSLISDLGIPCRDGWSAERDGHCYPATVPNADLSNALDSLPICIPAPQGMPIDITTGCVGQVICPDATYASEIGEHPSCTTASWDEDWVYCSFSVGIGGLFPDLDRDGHADEDGLNERVHIFPPHLGSDPSGLGVGASPRCFVDSLGLPDGFVAVDVSGTFRIQDMLYERYSIHAYDRGDEDGTGAANGLLDNVYLYGLPD